MQYAESVAPDRPVHPLTYPTTNHLKDPTLLWTDTEAFISDFMVIRVFYDTQNTFVFVHNQYLSQMQKMLIWVKEGSVLMDICASRTGPSLSAQLLYASRPPSPALTKLCPYDTSGRRIQRTSRLMSRLGQGIQTYYGYFINKYL